MAGHDKEVREAIVVQIDHSRTPTHESIVDGETGQSSSSKSAATAVNPKLLRAPAIPEATLTSVNVPSPLFRNKLCCPCGKPRGPQFTGSPEKKQVGFSPGFGACARSNTA